VSRAFFRIGGAAAVVLVLAPAPGLAGSIGFRTDIEVRSAAGIDATVTLTHTGDEAASDVSVHAEFDGKTVDGESVPSIPPSGTRKWDLHLADTARRGVHPVVLRVLYSDANGYPFEIVSVATATSGVEPAPRLFGSLDVPRLAGPREEPGRVTVKRPPGRTGDAEVRIVVPSGLTVEPERMRVSFDERGRATAAFRIRNDKLLAGTTVNIYALATADDAGFPQADTIRSTVNITASSMRIAKPRFYEAAAAMAALLLLLEVSVRLRERRREGAAA
jgi:hypothetical protein